CSRFWTIAREFVLYFVFAGGDGVRSADVGPLYAKVVILMVEFPILHMYYPAAKRAGLCNDHAVRVGVLQFHGRRNGEGTVLNIDERVFRHANHAWIDR